jgi:tetratricopeptide (TPR) repeat protein
MLVCLSLALCAGTGIMSMPPPELSDEQVATAMGWMDQYTKVTELNNRGMDFLNSGNSSGGEEFFVAAVETGKNMLENSLDSQLVSFLAPDATLLVAKACFNLGVALRDTKGHLAAIDAYYQALKLDPKLQEAHFNLGYTFQALADDKSAVGFYGDFHGRQHALKKSLAHYRNTTLGVGPKADAYRVMEEVQYQLGDYAGAQASYRQFLSMKPDASLQPYLIDSCSSIQSWLRDRVPFLQSARDRAQAKRSRFGAMLAEKPTLRVRPDDDDPEHAQRKDGLGGTSQGDSAAQPPQSLCQVQSDSPVVSPQVQSARASFEANGYAKLPRMLSPDACTFAARHFEALHTLEEEEVGV